ncbi:efflux RND transporter periplasmic adaptor subunit [Bythopirellula goksoeyrii]|uniref:Putative efflux pump membrane fusion protein n=1 Tax=Bythopirellula goksoeyrii TaxID=1400387 RepID=A0A5B9QBM2_9BACT|nr:efflux RND transporter periplasmic adaptor subunit [Bythopirellula goksoeyrii]QEG36338.1 putative efflux pump membrane fusion protein [Bythopirellula goksoeyrii]
MRRFLLLVFLALLHVHAVHGREPGTNSAAMLPGIVEARQSVDLSFPTTGTVSEIDVEEMQFVEEGQVLARLDDSLARASLAAAEAIASRGAMLIRAKSAVSLAEKYLGRVRDAYEKNAASGLELDEAEGRVEEARATLEQAHEREREAEAQVALEEVRLSGHELRAPFGGTVTRITGKPGGTANPNEPILRLTNPIQLRVVLHVPVAYFGLLNVGEEYALEAELPAPPRVVAQLLAQEQAIDAATDTFRCVFGIENSDLSLPVGFAVRLCDPTSDDSQEMSSSR